MLSLKLRYSCTVFLLLLSLNMNAQEKKPYGRLSFTTGIGIMQSQINDKNMEGDDHYFITKKNVPQFSFGLLVKTGIYGSFFTGFRFNTYQSTSVCNGWFKGPLSVDKDNFYYYPTYEADFIEENKISTLSIPIAYQFTTNQNKPSHFSFELGILNNFLLDNSIEIDGFYELRGMYPDAVYYNVFHLIEQSFQYGYSRYAPQRKYQVLKSFFISTYCGIGFTSSISNRVSLFTQLRYQLSLGDVINKKKQDIDYVDLTGYQSNYQKTNLKGMGFECGLSIRLNSKKGNRL